MQVEFKAILTHPDMPNAGEELERFMRRVLALAEKHQGFYLTLVSVGTPEETE